MTPMRALVLAAVLCLASAAPALAYVGFDAVVVADPGNAADDTGFGSVAATYAISRHEVSQADYAEFLNAVAASDPGELYDPDMGHPLGIARNGVAGSYSYSVAVGAGSLPVQFVSFVDALRYVNWLHNGQPSGAQGPTTTEGGVYQITLHRIAGNVFPRDPGARFFLPNEDEWYKAAYYDVGSSGYFDYPVGSDTETLCTSIDFPDSGNCDDAVTAPTPVGFYTNSPSPLGSFDQGGNVFEWTEGAIGSTRVMRGGSWFSDPADQASGFRASSAIDQQTFNLGFRVAPEPGAAASGLACLGALALLGRRRRSRPLLALFAAFTTSLGLAEGAGAITCSDHLVPAALADGEPQDQTIYAELCFPDVGASSAVEGTLIVFVHGITYTHDYWDIADPSDPADERYSFVKRALAAGFSTLGVDRLGAGQSSHPLSPQVNIDTNAHTLHEVIQAVRSGVIADSGGGTFQTIVLVGHSYGSWTSWFEISRHGDVDAAVFTGATHGLTQVDAPLGVGGNVYPAVFDPLYMSSGLDPGYLTTQPGTRYVAFYAPGPVDPAVIEADEASKGTLTNAEIQNYQLILAEPLDIRVPVFVTVGSNDTLFCGPEPGGADCSSEAALVAFESPFLGPMVPSVDAYILPGGGHDMNPMWNARLYFDAVLGWIQTTVLP